MDIESIADRAGSLYRFDRMDFPVAVAQALDKFSIVDLGIRDQVYREVCSYLSKRGALVKAAKAIRLAEGIARAAFSFFLHGKKFDSAIDAALDASSITDQRKRKTMHKRVYPLLSEQIAREKTRRKERLRQQALSQQGKLFR